MTTTMKKNYNNVLSKKVNALGDTIWSIFTPLAQKHQSVNLGQGFPDFDPPKVTLESLKNREKGDHQYTRPMGDLLLVKSLETYYNKGNEFGKDIDGMKEICVTAGATGALYTVAQTLVNPGDEVIIIEPFYDSYSVDVEMAGGKPVYVPLRAPTDKNETTDANDWKIDMEELKKAITKKTKAIMINTPHNPTGKVFTKDELQDIATLAIEHDIIVISDEVYDKLVFPSSPVPHVRIASLPGMFERTITICSAGKSFVCTGWKIGWIVAPEAIAKAAGFYGQYMSFCVSTPLQRAVADMVDQLDDLSKEMSAKMEENYKQTMDTIIPSWMHTVTPHAGYFVMARTDSIDFPYTPNRENPTPLACYPTRDFQFAEWIPATVGVTTIPPSAFYSPEHMHLA
eukprot:CAMPEP_0117426868 /NCGR_PEP_ID=MMETSP0758-20121206/6862_1 /TAXON_ID=63605 /ORGANISM="Percolomonas cosmopolitus, Strain AE-1 (ATCC 50343)" /LENGTH=398 /DNA_ID=CAMNT_0005212227 /DNA_START=29 /DNA_END=1221 /DNA_ORIENTATION=-